MCDLSLWPSDEATANFIEKYKPKCFLKDHYVQGNRITKNAEVMMIHFYPCYGIKDLKNFMKEHSPETDIFLGDYECFDEKESIEYAQ